MLHASSRIKKALGVGLLTAVAATTITANAVSAQASINSVPGGVANVLSPTENVFKQDVTQYPLDPQSAARSAAFYDSFKNLYGGNAAFNVWNYNYTSYIVDENTPRYEVKFNDCQKKGYVPSEWYGQDGQFGSVPIPDGAVPAAGTDKAMAIYSPSEDRLWEFWVAGKDANGVWSACWGGSIKHASQSNGQFNGTWGASASGLAGTAGVVTLADVRRGYIDHALSLAIPRPQKGFVYPAVRSDGWTTNPLDLKEGTRLRLDPSINVDTLPLTPIGKMIAKAGQKYGYVIVDGAGTTAFATESGEAEKAVTGVDPWKAILGKTPAYNVTQNFPWANVQVLQEGYGKPQPTSYRIDVGSKQDTMIGGVLYKADSNFVGGGVSTATGVNVGTQDPALASLYSTQRYGMSAYNLPIKNGTYNVKVRLVENYWNAAGYREFGITAEGVNIEPKMDVFKSAGGKNIAYDKVYTVTVNDGTLNLNFVKIKDNQNVAALEVLPAPMISSSSVIKR